ncbi:uncharacterized protein LOC121680410 [Alosa sapidissima]|uniref:uncharacterized protein LOC121680410 n=1 Tax=Alosa sapidissima TaxID=34773 RepID=UPI001C096E3A|nr:uncharacterized protein LOC121680410 [Alosa sapidissima]
MNFQYNYSNYTQDGFHQDQGIQHILTNQAGGTYFHGVAPTPGAGVINQPVIWPEYGYQPQQNHGLFGNPTALPQFLPVTEIPVSYPIPPRGYQGITLQDGSVAFDPLPQSPVMFVDPSGQQRGTFVTFHPQLQAPLVAMGGAGPQYSVPVPYGPHIQAPIIYVDANRQQCGTAVPFDLQLQAPFMLVDNGGLPHGNSMPPDPYLQTPLMPMDSTGLVPFNPVAAPSELAQLISMPQLPSIEELAAGLSSTGLMRPAPMAKLPAQESQQESQAHAEVAVCAPSGVTTESLKPEESSSTAVAEAKQAQAGQPNVKIEPQQPGTSGSKDTLVVKPKSQGDTKIQQLYGAMEDAEAKPADTNASQEVLKTAPVEVGKAEAKLPKKPSNSVPENADRRKDKKRKRKHGKGEKERKEKRHKKATSLIEKTTKSGDGEKEGPDTDRKAGSSKVPEDEAKGQHKDSSKKSTNKKANEMPNGLQPKRNLGQQLKHFAQVFSRLRDELQKLKHLKPTPKEAAKKSQDWPKPSNVPDHAPAT